MERTPNLSLPQWAADDPILRTDFNSAFAALDGACGNCRIATGSYVGTGNCGSANPTSITCGFAPKIVFIQGEATPYNNVPRYHILLWPLTEMNFSLNYPGSVTWSSTGVSWYNTSDYQLNKSGTTYHYIALG